MPQRCRNQYLPTNYTVLYIVYVGSSHFCVSGSGSQPFRLTADPDQGEENNAEIHLDFDQDSGSSVAKNHFTFIKINYLSQSN